jgi:hypothetical protein
VLRAVRAINAIARAQIVERVVAGVLAPPSCCVMRPLLTKPGYTRSRRPSSRVVACHFSRSVNIRYPSDPSFPCRAQTAASRRPLHSSRSARAAVGAERPASRYGWPCQLQRRPSNRRDLLKRKSPGEPSKIDGACARPGGGPLRDARVDRPAWLSARSC